MTKFSALIIVFVVFLVSCKKESIPTTYKYTIRNRDVRSVQLLMFSGADTLHNQSVAPADSVEYIFRQCDHCDLDFFIGTMDSVYMIFDGADTIKHYPTGTSSSMPGILQKSSWTEGPSNAYYKKYIYEIR